MHSEHLQPLVVVSARRKQPYQFLEDAQQPLALLLQNTGIILCQKLRASLLYAFFNLAGL